MSVEDIKTRIANASGYVEGSVFLLREAEERREEVVGTIGTLLRALEDISVSGLMHQVDTMAGHYMGANEAITNGVVELGTVAIGSQSSEMIAALDYVNEARSATERGGPAVAIGKSIRFNLGPKLQALIGAIEEIREELATADDTNENAAIAAQMGMSIAQEYGDQL